MTDREPAAEESDNRLLEEALRQAERVTEIQLAHINKADERTSTLLTVALASIAAGFTLAAFLLERVCGWAIILPVFAVGGVGASFWAAYRFVDSLVGVFFVYSLANPPSVSELEEYATSEVANLIELRLMTLASHTAAAENNSQVLGRVMFTRSRGLYALLAAAASYLIAGIIGAFVLAFGGPCA